MDNEKFSQMKKKLEKTFPHHTLKGRRNPYLPDVNIGAWASKSGVQREWLLKILAFGTKRMTIVVAVRLGDAFKWGRYTEVEEFINEVARRSRQEKVKDGKGYVVNPPVQEADTAAVQAAVVVAVANSEDKGNGVGGVNPSTTSLT